MNPPPEQRRCDYDDIVVSPSSRIIGNTSERYLHRGAVEDDKIVFPGNYERELPEYPSVAVNTSCCASTSPLSVTELFQPEEQDSCYKSAMRPPMVNPRRLCSTRGVDSPKKPVDTSNVFVSSFSKSLSATSRSRGSSKSHRSSSISTSSDTQGSLSLTAFIEALPIVAASGAQPKYSTNPLPPLSVIGGSASATSGNSTIPRSSSHRRQNTVDSSNSKDAAVVRGASKGAQETAEKNLDRPVACPRRQRTVESDAFPDDESSMDEQPPPPQQPKRVGAKSPARIRRPLQPSRDCVRFNGRESMQRMQRVIRQNKSAEEEGVATNTNTTPELDRPVPCPVRQATIEKPSALERDVSLTPEDLFGRFTNEGDNAEEKNDATSSSFAGHETRDDDDDDSISLDQEGAYFWSAPPVPQPTKQTTPAVIEAWLSMSSNNLNQEQQHQRWSESQKSLKVPSKDEEDEGKVTQALWSSMPVLESYHLREVGGGKVTPQRGVRSWPTARVRAESEHAGATTMPPTIPSRYRRQDSLLSTEADCDTMVVNPNATRTEQQRPLKSRASMPMKPHPRKPSLHLEDLAAMRSSLLPEKNNADTAASMGASLPVLSSECDSMMVDSTKRTEQQQLSPKSRASMPPLQPHRRKPSLNLEDLASMPSSSSFPYEMASMWASSPGLSSDCDTVTSMSPLRPLQRKPSLSLKDLADMSSAPEKRSAATIAGMWASLPVLSSSAISPAHSPKKRCSMTLPPAMPARRRPSLNISDDGEDIEMWLSNHKSPTTEDHVDAHKSVICPGSHGSGPAGSVVMSSRSHRRYDSFAGDISVCSIVLKEGEIEI